MPYLNLSVQHIQLGIQDFPEEGVSTLQGGVNTQFCKNFSKTARNLTNLTPANDIPWGGWEPVFHAGDNCVSATLC